MFSLWDCDLGSRFRLINIKCLNLHRFYRYAAISNESFVNDSCPVGVGRVLPKACLNVG